MKWAVYTDQIHSDPIEAAKIAADVGINNVCLRMVRHNNICRINNSIINEIEKGLNATGSNVVIVASNRGLSHSEQLFNEVDGAHKDFLLASKLGAKYLLLNCGRRSKHPQASSGLNYWLSSITDLSIKHDIIPVLSYYPGTPLNEPALVASTFRHHKRWMYLYNPHAIYQNFRSPFIQFWTLLKDRTSHIDLIDSNGFITKFGSGTINVRHFIKDYLGSKHNGYLCLDQGERSVKTDEALLESFMTYFNLVKNSFTSNTDNKN